MIYMLCVPVDHCFTLSCSHISGQRLIELTFSIAIWEVQWNVFIPRNTNSPVLVVWLYQCFNCYHFMLVVFSVVQNLIWRKRLEARTTHKLSVQSKLSELDSASDMW